MGIEKLSDAELEKRLIALVGQERESTAEVVEHLMEFDARSLPLSKGYASTHLYCTMVLGYTDSAAAWRIRAARAAQKFPQVLVRLREGRINIEGVARINPYLTKENSQELLDRIEGATKRDIQALAAALSPRSVEMDVIRPMGPKPSPAPAAEGDMALPMFLGPSEPAPDASLPAAPAENPPSAPESAAESVPTPPPPSPMRHRIAFTADEALVRKVERAKELLRHKYPEGRLEDIFLEAIEAYLDRHDPERAIRRKEARRAAKERRQEGSLAEPPREPGALPRAARRIPHAVREAVWKRDGGRCAFIAADGRRCGERGMLEYDHILPFAAGGSSRDPDNVRLLCRAHNQQSALRWFGERRRADDRPRA